MSRSKPRKAGRASAKTKGGRSSPAMHVEAKAETKGPTSLSRPKVELTRIRHELRTPINHIIGYSDLLLDEQEIPRAFADDLEKIRKGGKRLLELLNEYFRDESVAAKQDLRQVFHELRTPINQIIGYSELLQEQAEERGYAQLVPDLKRIHEAAKLWLAQAEAHLIPESAQARNRDNITVGTPAPFLAPSSFAVVRPANRTTVEPGRLLVVDDDESNRELLARRLQSQGHTVTTAETGRQALKLVAKQVFDLILLDVIMPLIGGLEVLQEIKSSAELRHIPVIMISALDDMTEVVRCIEMGAEDYLSKPFDPVLLRARIGAALEKKRLRDREQLHLAQLQAEQKRAEQLLLNVLPKPIADRLKQGEETIADSFKEVTVLFADLVGFTSYSLYVSAAELVDVLNEIFSSFDTLAAQLGLEKIKTIGDAYMAVAGLPQPRPDHAAAAAELALGMAEVIDAFNARYHASIKIRVGIHSGPVVAGVIGKQKFTYDLWGSTVNTASRMESHSLPGKIQVSAATFAQLRNRYRFTPRSAIDIKGMGMTQTWFLEGKSPE